jgi:hypothetical protein
MGLVAGREIVEGDVDGRLIQRHERHDGKRDDHDHSKQTRVRAEAKFAIVWHFGSPFLL